MPKNLLPIGEDPGGNVVSLSVSGPDKTKVYFCEHEREAEEGDAPNYDNVYFIANSFDDFLDNLMIPLNDAMRKVL